MATILEFTVDTDDFPLGSIFEDLSGVVVELERVVPTGPSVVPYFWVEGVDEGDILAHFEEHPEMQDLQEIDSFDSQCLFWCEWENEYAGILSGMTEANVALLTGVGTTDGWRFEVRGDSQEAISDFHQYCHDHDVPIRVVALHELKPVDAENQLTETQQRALLLAYERGYYDSPRETTLSDIGEELDISQQAAGNLLRRGTRRLIANDLSGSPSSTE